MARRAPPHLALDPPHLFHFLLRVWGSGEVAPRATSLGPKPPYFIVVCFCSFLFFAFGYRKTNLFSLKKDMFVVLECLPLFLLGFFASPFFTFSFFFFSLSPSIYIYISLSLSLSPSLSLSLVILFSFFLLVFLFCFHLVTCFCLFLSFSLFFFAFMKEQHQNIILQSFCPSIISLFLVSCLFIIQIHFSYLCFFSVLSCVFWFNINGFGFKYPSWKTPICEKWGGVQQNVFFFEPVFCKMWKVIVLFFLLPFLGQILARVQKVL